jgi:predicted enzyme related to lactoylglutathione lyase
MAGVPIVHFEIPADDPAALVDFYAQVFGWKIRKIPAPGFDYWACGAGEGEGITGAITKRSFAGQGITNYLTVDDIDGFLGEVVKHGGKVLVPRSPVDGMGWYALAADPQGNPIGFWQKDNRVSMPKDEQ